MDIPAAVPVPQPETPIAPVSRDAQNWAAPVQRLEVGEVSADARNINVAGRRVTSPVQGFGKMWQKTYTLRLEGVDVSPEQVVSTWKARFGEFWPRKNWFFGSLEGIKPGDVAVLNLTMGGVKVVTGVLVLYADERCFTVMTPEGHQFAGFNTFSAERDGDTTVVQIQALIRASDPVYELALPIIGHRMEDKFWEHTLQALGREFGIADGEVALERICVDKRRQWDRWRNIWQNAAIRSILYVIASPARWMAKPFRRQAT